MSDRLPVWGRSPAGVRWSALVVGALTLAIAAHVTLESQAWIGKVFPGFVVLDNRIIASIGLPRWTGSGVSDLHQSQVQWVAGRPVASGDAVYAAVFDAPPGIDVRYEVRKHGVTRDVVIATQRFNSADWWLLFGGYLFNGLVCLVCGLIIWLLEYRSRAARAVALWNLTASLFLLTSVDLYGPANYFRLHLLAEAFVPATALNFALLFPAPHRLAFIRLPAFGIALLVAVAFQVWIDHPAVYSGLVLFDMIALAGAGLVASARWIGEYRRGGIHRQRVRVVALGAVLAFAVPAVVLLSSAFLGGHLGMNFAAIPVFLFTIALAYSVVRHDLFEIDRMVKQTAYYLVLSGLVVAVYVAALILFNVVLQAQVFTDSPAFPLLFALATLLLFHPLRVRAQALIDRMFFGRSYDAGKILGSAGAQLVTASTVSRIVEIVDRAVADAVESLRTRLFVPREPSGDLRDASSGEDLPETLRSLLRERRFVSLLDSPEVFVDEEAHRRSCESLASIDAEVAVAIYVGEDLGGALTSGRKGSGALYTSVDVDFLAALAQEVAIALQNARSYETVVQLNASLESRVRERTAEVESAHRELERAYAELKQAESELVHSEKMASLGRLVAGVAHEINNPVSFISSNLDPLRRRLEDLAADATPRGRQTLEELEEIVATIRRGAERTAAIVRDLRSFSRIDGVDRRFVDLHEGLDVSLRLLGAAWKDRIAIHRDYGRLPMVECDPGQMNQVFMNILANAGEAIPGTGNVWIETRESPEGITVRIRDDGPGMTQEVVRRVFEPFFTTKDVGAGTGLGLAISHGIVAAHGGCIEVESAPDRGSVFTVVLPVRSRTESSLSRTVPDVPKGEPRA